MPLDKQTGDEIDPENTEPSFYEQLESEFGSELGSAYQTAKRFLANSFAKSGRFDTLFGKPLYYPTDLASNDKSRSEVTNWLEFRVFTVKNGNLDTIVDKVKNAFNDAVEPVWDESTAQDDEIENLQTFISETQRQFLGNDTALDQEGKARIQVVVNEKKKELSRLQQEKAKFEAANTPSSSFLASEVAKGDTLLNDSIEQVGDSVYLYLPGGLDFNDSLKYEEKDFGAIKALTTDLSAAGGLFSLTAIAKIAGGVDKAAALVGQQSLNTGNFIEKQLGVIINPRKEQMFQGVDFRKWDFKFDFAPRSKSEAQMVADIIKVFRFHAYPEISRSKAFFNFPSEFEITAKTYNPRTQTSSRNPALPKMNRCVLTDIKTNYTPEEVYHAFVDGFPPRIEMTLSFVEADYLTRQHIYEGY